MHTLIFILIFTGYPAFLLLVARGYWRLFKDVGQHPEAFNYRITDIWAATLSLTPTLVAIAFGAHELSNHSVQNTEIWRWVFVVLTLFSAQITGLFIGRIWCDLPGWNCRHQTFTSATLVFTGGLMGLLLPIAYYFFVVMLGIAIFAGTSTPALGCAFFAIAIPIVWAIRKDIFRKRVPVKPKQ